ncbi:3-oxoacyl-[acyl-carrier-protein] synthase III C-terminal domain-containing protein [Streptomyces sp. MA15]|uniref:type III polyketide synthase n=1 Tax=Streptomyces sp. MA15 TaxID=3055061 RepID=UPI0025B1D0F6|nr:3-oxoacyl-[acyl-carrier-protein] synthase III C-terminal domain-containing protein [Streptomyces sp. MA15]MDN3270635.1 3-oxoacyl-[acyl-carrier-protein] synthase III C-terminal domain-containing protein [Streptomyces sp. MA15]
MRVPLIADPAPAAPPPPDAAAATTAVAAVHTALPPHHYPQDRLTEPIGDLCLAPGADRAVLRRLHASAGVRTRHLALPIERYAALRDFRESNEAWLTAGLDLAERALTTALAQAGLAPADVDLLVCASITGVAAPSLDARLAGRVGLRPDVKRLPVFGLGCVAGAAGLARVHDYLRGHPGGTAVLLTVELCSLTLQKGDDSRANLVAGALFGDGAAALVARATATGRAGPEPAAGPTVLATRSHLYPGTEHLLGWDVGAGGFRVVIDPAVPALVRRDLGAQVRGFLAGHGLGIADIGAWVCHPGGPKVLEAVADALALPDDALAPSRRSLAAVGNLSSASVLHILQGFTEAHRPAPGTWGLLMAMGPGFCSELVLLRW